MKKLFVFLILALLLISSFAFVLAANNENETDLNETENGDDEEGKITVTQTKARGNKTTFVPWQKRNESECQEGCKCVGAVMSCPTETGKIITIQAGRSGNIITITIDKTEVNTTLELETENEQNGEGKNKTNLKAKLSNGRKAEIKVMPDTASERALERLRLKVCSSDNNCTIKLKEVGKKGEEAEEGEVENKLAYEVQAERHSRILFLFRKKMQVKGYVDAETGEVLKTGKPWWAFLAYEPEE